MFYSKRWSDSKLGVWLLSRYSIKKPNCATLQEWDDFYNHSKKTAPITFWVVDVGFDALQTAIHSPLDTFDKLRVWVKNRFINRYNTLHTGLESGVYHELDSRLLHASFNALVDFVEIEKAWMQFISDPAKSYKEYNMPWHQKYRYTRLFRWRSAKAGLDNLKWEIEECGFPPQQESSKIISDLYKWWKYERPSRFDPWLEARDFSDQMDQKYEGSKDSILGYEIWPEPDQEHYRILLRRAGDQEDEYYKEDTQKLVSLMMIRDRLWS
jgi:hypothetical protein